MTQTFTSTRPEEFLATLRVTLKKGSQKALLQASAQSLRQHFAHYSWVGVYLVKGKNLVLEAYAGDAETEHVTIPIGQGICGFAAKTGETIVVPDVSKDPRYLMCFPSTRSEIVVPIIGSKGVLGEIDIDSDKLAAFSRTDMRFLEAVAKELATYLESKKVC